MVLLPLALLLLAQDVDLLGQSVRIEEGFLKALTLPLEGSIQEPEGPGWEFLMRECAASEIVAIGEQHGLAEVPIFTAALFEALAKGHDFRYLALENGPWTMHRFGAPPFRGDFGAIEAEVRANPMCLAFAFREELALMAFAGKVSAAKHDPLWGIDQVTGASWHLFAIADALDDEDVSTEVARLAEHVLEIEQRRFHGNAAPANLGQAAWISLPSSIRELERIEELCAGQLPPEADARLKGLRRSSLIYAHNWAGRIYANNFDRETLIKEIFTERWRTALRRDGTPPKVVVKLGSSHLGRLGNVARVPSLGSYLSGLAGSTGGATFHLAVFASAGDLAISTDYPSMQALSAHLAKDVPAVLDLRRLREPALAGEFGELDPWLESLVFGYDAVLFLGTATPITNKWW